MADGGLAPGVELDLFGAGLQDEEGLARDARPRPAWFLPRHIQMMALGKYLQGEVDRPGSALATGLFFQTGKVLYYSGPVSMVLAFLLMGTVTYAVLVLSCGLISNSIDNSRRDDVTPTGLWGLLCSGKSLPFSCNRMYLG